MQAACYECILLIDCSSVGTPPRAAKGREDSVRISPARSSDVCKSKRSGRMPCASAPSERARASELATQRGRRMRPESREPEIESYELRATSLYSAVDGDR